MTSDLYLNEKIKLVFLGNAEVGKLLTKLSQFHNLTIFNNKGKSWLVQSFVDNRFPSNYKPSNFEEHNTIIEVWDRITEMYIWDIGGSSEQDEKLRSIWYQNTDVFWIWYSIDSQNSLDDVFNKWIPEIDKYTKNIPIMLIGNKIDLRENYEINQDLIKRIDAQHK